MVIVNNAYTRAYDIDNDCNNNKDNTDNVAIIIKLTLTMKTTGVIPMIMKKKKES